MPSVGARSVTRVHMFPMTLEQSHQRWVDANDSGALQWSLPVGNCRLLVYGGTCRNTAHQCISYITKAASWLLLQDLAELKMLILVHADVSSLL